MIQGTSADITKLALCIIYWKIHDELKISHKVHLAMQVHDQVDTCAEQSFAEEWKTLLTECMEEAAAYIVTDGTLKSETTVSDRWSK